MFLLVYRILFPFLSFPFFVLFIDFFGVVRVDFALVFCLYDWQWSENISSFQMMHLEPSVFPLEASLMYLNFLWC